MTHNDTPTPTVPDADASLESQLRDEIEALRGELEQVRADSLRKLGRLPDAGRESRRAASLTRNARERALMESLAAQCGD